MDFRILGLDASLFDHLFGLTDEELAQHGAKRFTVTKSFGFPDRVEMRDCAIGETVLLLNFEHLAVDTPYRSRHAIFVREGSKGHYDAVNQVPDVIAARTISLRAFSHDGDMLDADLVEGSAIVEAIERMFGNEEVAYLHAHNAKRGCYAGRIERA